MAQALKLFFAGLALGVVWIGPGWLLGGAWQQGLVGVLQDIGVQVAVGDPGALAQQQLTLAAILSLSGPFAALGRIVVSRLAAAPPTLWRLAVDSGIVFFGGNLGLGGGMIGAARIAVPHALEASVRTGAVMVTLEDLSMTGWALGGVAGAAVFGTIVAAGQHLLRQDAPPAA